MMKLVAGAFPGRMVHRVRDAAFHGQVLVEGAAWTTRLPANAVLCGLKPTRAGMRGRRRSQGRLGTCAQIAQGADWRDTTIHAYGQDATVQVAEAEALWHGGFKTAPDPGESCWK